MEGSGLTISRHSNQCLQTTVLICVGGSNLYKHSAAVRICVETVGSTGLSNKQIPEITCQLCNCVSQQHFKQMRMVTVLDTKALEYIYTCEWREV
jgi:hypothetical protein